MMVTGQQCCAACREADGILVPGHLGAASKWQAQSQHSFASVFLVQVPNSGEQQVIKRNHPEKLPVITVDYGKPGETGFGHTQHGGTQRLIGISHHGFSQHIG